MRTSAGTLGFVASSSKGSPGASARIVNSTALIPASTGTEISVRRSRYLYMVCGTRGGREVGPRTWVWDPAPPPPQTLRLLRPIGEGPEVAVPPALDHVAHPVGDRRDARAEHHGNDHDVLDHEIVHFHEKRRTLDRVHLGLGRLPRPVVLLVAPAGLVRQRELVVLGGNFP